MDSGLNVIREDKATISKILGEMKNQFNCKTQTDSSVDLNDLEKIDEISKTKKKIELDMDKALKELKNVINKSNNKLIREYNSLFVLKIKIEGEYVDTRTRNKSDLFKATKKINDLINKSEHTMLKNYRVITNEADLLESELDSNESSDLNDSKSDVNDSKIDLNESQDSKSDLNESHDSKSDLNESPNSKRDLNESPDTKSDLNESPDSKSDINDSHDSKSDESTKVGVKRKKKVNCVLKRSLRQKSTDGSVLQSAISRKEKLYEYSQPKRVSRQLKPTQKILENIAIAAALKKSSSKIKQTKNKSEVINKTKKNKMPAKKTNNTDLVLRKSERRSERIVSISQSKDDFDDDLITQTDEVIETESDDLNMGHSVAEAELIASRLCLCTQKSKFYQAESDADINCSAIDDLSGKLIGCNQLVDCSKMSMLRPSSRVPYKVLCEIHKQRMLRHNCCATCGIFCTEGRFSQCKNNHQYHRDCQISVGKVECCPHCGNSTPDFDIYIKMMSPKQRISKKP